MAGRSRPLADALPAGLTRNLRSTYPMWRPPQRIKWHPKPGPWPTAREAAQSRLFQPIDVGPIRLATRTWVPAMVPWRATDEGFVTPANIEWYARFAQG